MLKSFNIAPPGMKKEIVSLASLDMETLKVNPLMAHVPRLKRQRPKRLVKSIRLKLKLKKNKQKLKQNNRLLKNIKIL